MNPLCPFVVVIDSAEQFPYHFTSMKSRAHDNAIFDVKTKRLPLGRHPNSKGDYSIYGFTDRVGVERKSMEDGQSTLLDRERCERFECELENLAKLEDARVVVECDFQIFFSRAPATDNHTSAQNARTLFGTVMSLQSRFRVPWIFAGDREFAEIVVFRFFERFYRKSKEQSRGVRNPPESVRASSAPSGNVPPVQPVAPFAGRIPAPAVCVGDRAGRRPDPRNARPPGRSGRIAQGFAPDNDDLPF